MIRAVSGLSLHVAILILLPRPLAADTSPPRTSFNPASANIARTTSAHSGPLRSIAYSADGRTRVTLGNDRQIRVWTGLMDKPSTTLTGLFHPDRVWLSADATTLIAQDVQTLVSHNLVTGVRKNLVGNIVARGFSVSPDGMRVATSTRAAHVAIFSTQTGEEIMALEGPQRVAGTFAWSPDGQRLVEISQDRIGRMWDAAKGTLLTELEAVKTTAADVKYSTDGSLVAIALADAKIRIFNGRTGVELLTVGDRAARAQSLAFSRDDRFLASGHFDGTIRFWDVKTGREVRRLQTQGGTVWSLTFTPDHRWLLSGTNDGRLIAWGQPRGLEPNPNAPALRAVGQPAFLGVTPDADFNGVGVRIDVVHENSAAARAGLQPGDIIRTLGGEEVKSFDELRSCLLKRREGDAVEIRVERDGTEQKLNATLGARPEE